MVKSIEHHLRRVVGETLLTIKELMTLLAQIEAILNSRFLEPLNDDNDDVSVLTPDHLLIRTALTTLSESSLNSLDIASLSR